MKGNDECGMMNDELFYVKGSISWRRIASRLAFVLTIVVAAFLFAGQAVAQNAQEQQPKKINERPVGASATPSPEPFDGATAEKMAGQCVKLDTEAG